ncbi:unnamed protein product [Meganyctiphanes norvegica]|uniref:Adenosine 3'-phospho 5'-phosphosulfate transporter 2 n=1 Tax=Meganyctiphanes norvegica TaxID=48144 RepID=A0AAV2S291_MEGNR
MRKKYPFYQHKMSAQGSVSVEMKEDASKSDQKVVMLLGITLSSFSPTVAFLICSAAVFLFYLMYGYVLELIFTLDGMRPHGWYLTLIQFAYYSFFALIQIFISGESIKRKIPFGTYAIIALLTVGTMGFSNSSVGYLNYPTQVIFKSCKLIPVMIGSIIILGKRYSFAEVCACLCMSIGLIWFTLADSTVQPSFSITGIVLVSCALLCDAVIGNVQEGAMKKYSENTTHVVLYSYSIGFFIILVGLVFSGQMLAGVSFATHHQWEVYGRAVLLSLAGFCGVQAVLTLVTLHGALIAVTVTTARKAITICLSFVLFSKPFTIQYIWGGLLVLLGIYLNIYGKNNKGAPIGQSLLVSLQQLYLRIQRYFSPKNGRLISQNTNGSLNV